MGNFVVTASEGPHLVPDASKDPLSIRGVLIEIFFVPKLVFDL